MPVFSRDSDIRYQLDYGGKNTPPGYLDKESIIYLSKYDSYLPLAFSLAAKLIGLTEGGELKRATFINQYINALCLNTAEPCIQAIKNGLKDVETQAAVPAMKYFQYLRSGHMILEGYSNFSPQIYKQNQLPVLIGNCSLLGITSIAAASLLSHQPIIFLSKYSEESDHSIMVAVPDENNFRIGNIDDYDPKRFVLVDDTVRTGNTFHWAKTIMDNNYGSTIDKYYFAASVNV